MHQSLAQPFPLDDVKRGVPRKLPARLSGFGLPQYHIERFEKAGISARRLHFNSHLNRRSIPLQASVKMLIHPFSRLYRLQVLQHLLLFLEILNSSQSDFLFISSSTTFQPWNAT